MCMDCFFFDGAANKQKAEAILCATYPQAESFHGGDHVVSLFFSNLSKLKSIQVSYTMNIFFLVIFFLTIYQRLFFMHLLTL